MSKKTNNLISEEELELLVDNLRFHLAPEVRNQYYNFDYRTTAIDLIRQYALTKQIEALESFTQSLIDLDAFDDDFPLKHLIKEIRSQLTSNKSKE